MYAVLARVDGEPVGATLLHESHGIAGVYWVAVLEEARGRGVAAAMVQHVTNVGFHLGAANVQLQASAMGEPIYRRLGYEELYRYRLHLAMPPASSRHSYAVTSACSGRRPRRASAATARAVTQSDDASDPPVGSAAVTTPDEIRDIGAIDLMLSVPTGDPRRWYDFLRKQLLDRESREDFEFPAQYMFKNVPHLEEHMDDPVGLRPLRDGPPRHRQGDARHVVPERGHAADHQGPPRPLLRQLRGRPQPRAWRASASSRPRCKELGAKAATAFPAGMSPQVPINDKKFYPLYAKCVELDIPICVCAGIPGPRVPFECQNVAHIDEVCWFFPELKFVTRHGCEPWADLAVKLMLKWPNLYYSTSAFAPKYYPKDVIHYANTRGADKVMYAGYFPMGLTLERIWTRCPTCRSATTCGRSSSARTRGASSSSMTEPVESPRTSTRGAAGSSTR